MVFSWLNLAIVLALVAGAAFAAGPLAGSVLLAPRWRGGDHSMPYECGMEPHGASWMRFTVNYWLYALIFLAFDVDVLYLFPVAAHYVHSEGWLPLVKLTIFIVVLALGIVYFWRKGVFAWPRRISE